MSGWLALALAAAPAAEPAPAVAEEIVVIGERLKEWRGNWRTRNGALTCKTTRSTGDAEIDAIGCQALTTCLAPIAPQMKVLANAKLAKSERDRRMTALGQSAVPCLTDTRNAAVDALAARRAGV
jgi:hypothetical protein